MLKKNELIGWINWQPSNHKMIGCFDCQSLYDFKVLKGVKRVKVFKGLSDTLYNTPYTGMG